MGWDSWRQSCDPSCTRHRCVDVRPLNLPFDDPLTCCLGNKRNKKHSQAGLESVASRHQVSEQIAAVNWDQSLLTERIKAGWQAKALAPPRNKTLKIFKKKFLLDQTYFAWDDSGMAVSAEPAASECQPTSKSAPSAGFNSLPLVWHGFPKPALSGSESARNT